MTVASPMFIVGLGGTTRTGSTTELAVRHALRVAESLGARTRMFAGRDLIMPPYAPETPERCPEAIALVEALRSADGVIIGSPGYHGGMSGLVKNALDYTEDLRTDARVYFEGRPVGCIVTAAGWQAAGTTMVALRAVVHALRGWPTPMAATINSTGKLFEPDGRCLDIGVEKQLGLVAAQVVSFCRMSALGSADAVQMSTNA